jgi:hypothetical protein
MAHVWKTTILHAHIMDNALGDEHGRKVNM